VEKQKGETQGSPNHHAHTYRSKKTPTQTQKNNPKPAEKGIGAGWKGVKNNSFGP